MRLHRSWVSIHIFAPSQVYGPAGDTIIVGPIHRLVTACVQEKLASKWFFIRYSEGGPHIRLRLRPCSASANDKLMAFVERARYDMLEQHGLRSECVPYGPEVQRYGGEEAISFAESHFMASSRLTMELLTNLEDPSRELRLGRALFAMLITLHGLGGMSMVTRFPRRIVDGFVHPPPARRDVSARWAPIIAKDVTATANAIRPAYDAACSAIATRHGLPDAAAKYLRSVQRLRRQLRVLRERQVATTGDRSEDATAFTDRMAISYVHMTNNRLGLYNEEELHLARVTMALAR